MAISASRVTRFGLSAYMAQPYGSFAGKTATIAIVVKSNEGFLRNVGRFINTILVLIIAGSP